MPITIVKDGAIISDAEKYLALSVTLFKQGIPDYKTKEILEKMSELVSYPNGDGVYSDVHVTSDPIHRGIVWSIGGKSFTNKLDRIGIKTEYDLWEFVKAANRKEGFGPQAIGLIAAYLMIRECITNPAIVIARFFEPSWKEYNKAIVTCNNTVNKWNEPSIFSKEKDTP